MDFQHDVASWQALLDSAGEGIWGVDLNGDCTFVNQAALGMLHYQAEELVGRNMHRMVHHHYPDGRPYPGQDCSVYRVFRENKPFRNQIDHVFRKDGTMFWTEMSAQPILHEGQVQGAIVTFRDITQAQQTEKALRHNEKLAAVGQLASSIAHEINNPLEAVTNLLYLIRNSDDMAETKAYAAIAEAELARVADITQQTLLFHRQQQAPAPADIANLITSLMRLHTSRISARGVEIRLQLKEAPPVVLLEGDIRQVLNNLIRNAYEAMADGGTLTVRLREARCRRTGKDGVMVTIADTGTGFLPEIREKLFEPFQTSKEQTGTGLGLWVSKGIIDKHRGKLLLRSRMDLGNGLSGSVFQVWLPLGA